MSNKINEGMEHNYNHLSHLCYMMDSVTKATLDQISTPPIAIKIFEELKIKIRIYNYY